MKKLYILLTCLCIAYSVSSQTILLNEGFEGSTSVFSSSSASSSGTPWAATSSFANNGSYSDSNNVQLSDTLYLTSNSFSTIGYTYVLLEFSQIAKIHLFDKAVIEVSSDNGSTWRSLTAADYKGTAFFSTNNYFSSLSYPIWEPANFTSIPKNSWWQTEKFDISSISSATSAMIRFVLIDADNNGSRGSYGWLLDDVKVTGAPCELNAPTINIVGSQISGTVNSRGPYAITADVQDASGVASVMLNYSVNGGALQLIAMNRTSGNEFSAIVPRMSYGDTVCYSIVATDSSACSNVGSHPISGCTQFVVKKGTPAFCPATPESSYPYTENFDQFTTGTSIYNPGIMLHNWKNSTSSSSNHMWFVYAGRTPSSNTGPSSDHTSGSGKYVYIEASGYFNVTAVLESPCFDLSGSKKKLGFWYHMLGTDMGELHIDAETISGTVQNIAPAIVGNQGNSWKYMEIDLAALSGQIVKIKFRGITGNNFSSDIAIDDVTIFEEPADVKMLSLISPSPNGCSGGTAEYVTVEVQNLGSMDVDTIPVAYKVNSGAVVRDTLFLNILSNTTALFTFQQTVNMSLLSQYTISIWTELGNDGDVSNDSILNVLLNTSQLSYTLPDTQDFESFTTGTPGTMMDGWANDASFTNQWYVNSGSTPTSLTGPSDDTSSTAGNGNYLYVDAAASSGQYASVLTACRDISTMVKPKMKFFYHMYGQDVGSLHIDVVMNGIRFNDIVPPIVSDQGNKWNSKTIDLSQFSSIARIAFRVKKGTGSLGDIAIDQVIFYEDPVGLDDNFSGTELSFDFHPNPAKESIWVEVEEKNVGGVLSIRNISGKLMKEVKLSSRGMRIDLARLPAGIYFVSYLGDNGLSSKKLILY